MIKLAVVCIFGVVWGGRLENTYLPPSGAKTAGGNGNLLGTPFSNRNGATVVGDGGFGNGVKPASGYGAPISASSTIGSNGRKFGPIGNDNYRRNGQLDGFGFTGGKSPAPIFNGALGNGAKLSPQYGAPVISDDSVVQGPSSGNDNGFSPIGNYNYRRNDQLDGFGFTGGKSPAPIFNGALGNGAKLSPQYGAPVISGDSVVQGPSSGNGNGFSPIGNYNYRRNGQLDGFGFTGGKSPAPIFNGALGNGAKLSPQYGAPVISGDSVVQGPSSGNGNGFSPVYGVPAQNGIQVAGSYSGRLAAPINILRYNNENDGIGTYKFEYETENHISQQERGDLKNIGTSSESSVVQGTYSYAGPDGHTYTVNYIADEYGFQPTGEHIHLAVQAAAADAAQSAATDGKAGGYNSGGQYQTTANDGYRY